MGNEDLVYAQCAAAKRSLVLGAERR
jgi:hypothetical protein